MYCKEGLLAIQLFNLTYCICEQEHHQTVQTYTMVKNITTQRQYMYFAGNTSSIIRRREIIFHDYQNIATIITWFHSENKHWYPTHINHC